MSQFRVSRSSDLHLNKHLDFQTWIGKIFVMQATRKFTVMQTTRKFKIIPFSKTSFKRETSSPEQTWTSRMPKILKCPSIWISSSVPYLRKREEFLEGAMARCYAITTSSVSRWLSSCIQFWWGILKFLFQMDSTTPKTKIFCYNIQTWSCKPRFLPNTEWEPLGKDKADNGRRQGWTLSLAIIQNDNISLGYQVVSSLFYKQIPLIGLHLNSDALDILRFHLPICSFWSWQSHTGQFS